MPTLRSRDRIFDFSQEMVKISAAQGIGHLQKFWQVVPVQQAGTVRKRRSIKAERPEPSDHLRSTCTRVNTTSARLGGSQQLEILPSPNSKRAQNFSTWVLIGAEVLEARQCCWRSNFTRRGDFNVCLSSIVFCQAHGFCFLQKFSAEVFRNSFPQQISA